MNGKNSPIFSKIKNFADLAEPCTEFSLIQSLEEFFNQGIFWFKAGPLWMFLNTNDDPFPENLLKPNQIQNQIQSPVNVLANEVFEMFAEQNSGAIIIR